MKNSTYLQEYLGKTFWACAPLLWGVITYFLAWGPGHSIPLSYAMRLLLGIVLLGTCFYKTLQNKQRTVAATWFEYTLHLPSWLVLCAGSSFLLVIYQLCASPIWTANSIIESLVFGVCAGVCLEELLARTLFIAYPMGTLEFVFFNTLSACTFTAMHAFYQEIPPSWYALFFEHGHFQFAFLLGLIAYKSQRIELSILLHMASNLLRYTLPVLVLKGEMLSIGLISLVFACVELLILGGIGHKKQSKAIGISCLSLFPCRKMQI